MKRNKVIILLLLFLIPFLLRVMLSNDGLFHHDSVQLAFATESSVEEGHLKPTVNGRYGLVLLSVISFQISRLFGATQAGEALTIMTIFFASLLIPLFYLIVKMYTKSIFLPFSAALLFAFTPVFLSVSTYAKSHSPALFFGLMAFYLFQQGLSKPVWWMILGGLSFAFSLLIRADTILLFCPLFFMFLFPLKSLSDLQKKPWSVLILFSMPSLIIIFGSFFNRFLFVIAESDLLPDTGIVSHIIASIHLFFQAISLWIFIPALIGIGFLILHKQWYTLSFLLFWVFSTSLPFILSRVSSLRFFLLALLPICILSSYAFAPFRRKHLLVSSLILLLLIGGMLVSIWPVVSYRHDYSGPKEYGLEISRLTEPDAFIIENDNAPFIEYYGNRKVLGYPRLGTLEEINQTVQKIYDLLEQGTPIYVTSYLFGLDAENTPSLTLQNNFVLEERGVVDSENYHHAELELKIRTYVIYEVLLDPGRNRSEALIFHLV
ncbi:MAG: hypothetical protein ABIH34_00050 [Nanoarchaeota archaeon]